MEVADSKSTSVKSYKVFPITFAVGIALLNTPFAKTKMS